MLISFLLQLEFFIFISSIIQPFVLLLVLRGDDLF